MTEGAKSYVHVAAALVALTLAIPAHAQVPAPEEIEVIQTSDGPRVLVAGVGVGTTYARVIERVGGTGIHDQSFGAAGSLVKMGTLDGVECGLGVSINALGRVDEMRVVCDGRPSDLQRLADRYRAALSKLPSREDDRGVWFGDPHTIVGITIEPVDDDPRWFRTFGPRRLQVGFRR